MRKDGTPTQEERAGVDALGRLVHIAQGDTGQSGTVARFLLGLYNGRAFPFDLTGLRGIDRDLHDDCMAVLIMDRRPRREVHRYIEDGGAVFADLAARWGAPDSHRGPPRLPPAAEVIEDQAPQPAGWTVTVTPTQSGQWRWGVLDPDGVEICGGGGYDDEDEARAEGESELAAHAGPARAVVV